MTEENPYESPKTCLESRPIDWALAWAVGSSMGILAMGLMLLVKFAFYTAPTTWTEWDTVGFGCAIFGMVALNYWAASKLR